MRNQQHSIQQRGARTPSSVQYSTTVHRTRVLSIIIIWESQRHRCKSPNHLGISAPSPPSPPPPICHHSQTSSHYRTPPVLSPCNPHCKLPQLTRPPNHTAALPPHVRIIRALRVFLSPNTLRFADRVPLFFQNSKQINNFLILYVFPHIQYHIIITVASPFTSTLITEHTEHHNVITALLYFTAS